MNTRLTTPRDLFTRCRKALTPYPRTVRRESHRPHVEPLEGRIAPAVAISASNVDSLAVDVDGDGQFDPGDTIQYTINISNSGSTDATGISFSDNEDSNTTLVGGSVKITPIAFDDAYSLTGNTPITIAAGAGVLANDIDPDSTTPLSNVGVTAIGLDVTGTAGTVVLNANGSFTFTPNTGFTGATSFKYTARDAGSLDSVVTGTVSLNVTGLVWYVDSAYAGGGNDGSFNKPFTALSSLNTGGDPDGPGDTIFVYDRGGSYAGGITLENTQTLRGDGAAFSVNGMAIGASANNTVFSTGASNALTLASGNTVSGLSLVTTTGTGLSGTSFGAATISGVSISATGGAAVNLNTGSGTIGLTSVSATGGTSGIVLTNVTATSFAVNGDGSTTAGGNASGGTIQNTTGDAIVLNGASNVTLRNMTITNPAGHGVNADNLTGVNLFQSLTVQNFDTLNTDGITVDQSVNFTSVTLDRSLFTDAGAHGGNDGFRFVALSGNSAAGTVNVTASEFTELDGDGIQINNDGSGTINTTITGNNLHAADTTGGGNFNTLSVNLTGNGVLNATIGGAGALGNTLNDVARVSANDGALHVAVAGPAALGGADLNAVIENNTISNIPNRRGIHVVLEASAANHTVGHDITIKDNKIDNITTRQGIYVAVTGITGVDNQNVDLTITGNLVGTGAVAGTTAGTIGTSGRPGIHVQVFDDFANAGTALETDILLQNNQVRVNNTGDVVRIEAGAGLAANTANVEATVLGNTFTNDNAGGDGFQADVGFFTGGVNTFSLDLNSANVPANRNSTNRNYVLNHDKTSNAATDFNVEVDGVGLSGGGPFTDAQVETFFNARNTGTVSTPANSDDFTGVAAVTQPLLAIAPPTTAAVAVTDAGSSDGQAGSDAQVRPADAGSGVITQAELDGIVEAAIGRWSATGLSAAQAAALDSVTVAVADMPGWYLGAASPGLIQIDSNAGGWGWFIDRTPLDDSEFHGGASPGDGSASRVDLLSAVMHELGHVLGLEDTYDPASDDSVMYGYGAAGERHLPVAGQADGATPGSIDHEEFLIGPLALGTLPAGKTVRVLFQTSINSLTNGLAPTISNQGTVSGSNFSNVLTDDPAAGGAADPTTTTLDSLTLGNQVWIETGGNSVFDSGTDTGANPIALTLFLSDGTTVVTTGSTNGSGVYQFTGLLPGDYIVRVDASNFGTTLNGKVSITGGTDPDDNLDHDDNGVDNAAPATNGIRSLPITLAYNTEPTAGTGNDTNNTLDFGFQTLSLDFGDAPDPTYPTLLASNGAVHTIGSLFLGASVDAEANGQPNATATGDDLAGIDDENGVTFTSLLIPGNNTTVTVNASVVGGKLDAWVDFNDDGDWSDSGEQIFTSTALAAGNNLLSFAVPAGAALGAQTFSRFRLSTAGGLAPAGAAADGEVEDYLVETAGTTVTNTNDTGLGSLRVAILASNGATGMQTIGFNIAGAGVHTIQPASALPDVTDPAIIDGTTEPGFAGAPVIELDGSLAGAAADGLKITAGSSTVKGLAINRFSGSGIVLKTLGGNFVTGNYIGTDVTGTTDLGNTLSGVLVDNSPSNTIGGTTAGARNVISGNDANGVFLSGAGTTSILVQGNYIGTDVTGAVDLGNTLSGVRVDNAGGNTIGGTVAAARNVISGNNEHGVFLSAAGAIGNLVQGNFIGTNAAGTGAVGNTLDGVRIAGGSAFNAIGGTAAGAGNTIAFNSQIGVAITGTALTTDNHILRNSIFSNGALGIDLNADGVTPNDVNDPDPGPNKLQNFPVISIAEVLGANLNITYSVPSIAPNSTFPIRVEFFINSGAEGKTFLGADSYNAPGQVAIIPVGAFVAGDRIVATATDNSGAGSTSEFSPPNNAAPVLLDTAVTVGSISATTGAPVGAVGTLVSSLVDLNPPAGGQDNVTDADPGSVTGVAITAADAVNGTWFYSTNDGANWASLTGVSDSSARLLAAAPGNRVYFQPSGSFAGAIANGLTFRAWDQINGLGNGTLASTTTNGGSTSYSSATDDVAVTVVDAVSVATLAVGDDTATEAGDTGLFTFKRVSTVGSLVANFQLDAGSTASASDFTVTGAKISYTPGTGMGTVTFDPGVTTMTASLTAPPEALQSAEAAETVKLNVVPSAGVYTAGTPANATVTIAQNGFIVTTTGDSGEGSLRQAIANANALAGTDTITFAGSTFTDMTPDTITLTSGELVLASDLTVQGPGASLLKVSGGNASRVWRVAFGSTDTISGLTIADGNGVGGGASGYGGGVFNEGALTVRDAVVSGNQATRGGGLASQSGSLTLINSTVVNNSSGAFGGGVEMTGGTLTVVSSTLSGNNSGGEGGGIRISSATATITNSTISGNSAAANGGGIANESTFLTVNDSTITGNRSDSDGNTFGDGGGIFADGSETLNNTIVAGNFNGTGTTPYDISRGIETAKNNLIGDATTAGGITHDADGNPSTGNNNIVGNAGVGTIAIGTVLAPLANNGGPTFTHALIPNSPALNTGDATLRPADTFDLDGDSNTGELLPVDQRGGTFGRVVGTGLDIGAFELGNIISIAADNASKLENAGGGATTPFTFTVSRLGGNSGDATLNYAVTGTSGNPAAGADFVGGTLPSGMVTIPDGSASTTLTINVSNDTLVEGNEEFTVTLTSPPASYVLGTATAASTITDNDTASLAIVSTLDVTEQGGTQNVTVSLTTSDGAGGPATLATALTADVVDATGGTAGSGVDYTAFGTKMVTFAIGSGNNATQTVGLAVLNDSLLENNETVNLRLQNLSATLNGQASLGNINSVVTITDNETATLAIVPTLGVTEPGGTQNVTVTLNIVGDAGGTAQLGAGISVTGDVVDAGGGTAASANDYTAFGTKPVTFAAGSNTGATQTVGLAVLNDTFVEGSETVNLRLQNLAPTLSGRVTLGNASSVVTITDNDTATLAIVPTLAATEPGGTQNLVVTLTTSDGAGGFATLATALTADVVDATGGTATSGADYAAFGTKTVTFNASSGNGATQNVGLAVLNDSLLENSETVNLRLQNLSSTLNGQATLGNVNSVATIADNETATLAIVPTLNVTEQGGTQNVTVTLNIVGDAGGTAQLGAGISVTGDVVDAGGGTATSGNDYTAFGTQTVTFAAGSNTGATQTVGLAVLNDTLVEGSETVNLRLQNPAPLLGGRVTLGNANSAVTITDNDTATLAIVPTLAATEPGGTQNLVVTLTTSDGAGGFATLATALTADVVDAGGGTASSGVDYTAFGTKMVTFAIGSGNGATQNAGLAVLNDSLLENNETVNLRLQNLNATLNGQASLGNINSVATIADNETATLAIVPTLIVTEQGGTQNVTVTLNIVGDAGGTAQLGAGISVTGDVVDAGGGTATSGNDYTAFGTQMVTFAPGSNTGATQTVGLAVLNDTFVEGSETVNLLLQNPTPPLGGRVTLGNANSAVTITDNDTATLAIVPTLAATEPGGTQNLVVTLTTSDGAGGFATLATALTADVVDATGGTATSGADYTAFGTKTVTFAVNSGNGATQNAGLAVLNDSLLENNETVNLRLQNLNATLNGQASLGNVNSVATIADNETATLAIVPTLNVTEQGGTQNVTVTLNIVGDAGGTAQLGAGISVTGDVVDAGGGTATSGNDYTAFGTQTVTFAPGSNSGATQTVGLAVLNDTLVEGSETVNLRLQNQAPTLGGRVTLGNANSAVTITDNDTATLAFALASSQAPEATTPHLIGVTLLITANGVAGTGTLGRDVMVNVDDLLTGSASAGGTDYTFTDPSTVSFGIGEAGSTKNASFTIVNDAISEGDETINLALNALVDGTGGQLSLIGGATAHTVTIVDNDVDLKLTKTESVATVLAGSGAGNLVYTITLKNNGLVDATGIVVAEDLTLPAGVTLVSAVPSAGTFAATVAPDGTWTIPALAKGASETLTVTVTASASTLAGTDVIGDTATITGATQQIVNPGDDAVTEPTSVSAQADLQLTKADAPDPARRGQNVTYTINLANAGPSDAQTVSIADLLPAGTTFVSSTAPGGWTAMTPAVGGTGTVTFTKATVASAETGVFTIVVKVNTNTPATSFANTATVTTTTTDTNPADNSATATSDIYAGIYVTAPGIAQANKFGPPKVRVFDPATSAEIFSFLAYEPTYKDSIRVAVGDMNNDGFDDVITTTAKGTGRLRVFLFNPGANTFTMPTVGAFSAELAVFDGKKDKGAFVAAGDVNGDGLDDIVVGSALGRGKVKVFNGATGLPVTFASTAADFLQPFGTKFTGGVRVATGDLDGDGKDEVVVGQGLRGAGVKVFAGKADLTTLDTTVMHDFTIKNGTKKFTGGVSVATGDLDGDGKADLIVGRNTGKPTQIETFKGTNLAALGGPILPFDANPAKLKYALGVRVAAVDVNGDGIADIIAGAGGKADSQVKIYDGSTHALLRTLTAYPDFLTQALFVAGSAPVPV